MERKIEDNTVFVLQKIINKYKIKVTSTSIREYLLAHPHYPSLKSLCDALNKWSIDHYALKLEIDEIKDLELPFIAHLKSSELVFVEKIENNKVFYSFMEGLNKTETFVEFAKGLSGAVVVLENNIDSGERDYKKIRQKEILNNTLLPLGIFTILLVGILTLFPNYDDWCWTQFFPFWGLVITKFTGIAVSLLLVLYDFKIKFSTTDKICSLNTKTGCDEVLDSDASHLFGWVNWSDAGLVYFIGTFLYLLGSSGNYSLGFLSYISLISLPYPLFSIYYQLIKIKKWCPFCVIVQLVLITEFLFLFPMFKMIVFHVNDAIRLISSFFVPAVLWLLYKAYYITLIDFRINQYSLFQFKRNAEVFDFLVKKSDYKEFVEEKNSLVLGSPDAPVTLTAFLSLHCGPCAKAFKQLKLALQNCPELKVDVIFSVFNDEVTKQAINTLYYLQSEKGTEATLNFLDKWYSLPMQMRKSLLSQESISDQFNFVQQIGYQNEKKFQKFQVKGTPRVFINGYLFPKQYNYTDIQYFIEIILQLNRNNKTQEFCTISD